MKVIKNHPVSTLCSALLLALLPGAAQAQSSFCQVNTQTNAAPFVSGMDAAVTPDGSERHPYRICNVDQLTAVAADKTLWGYHYELESNLDLTGYSGIIGTANNAVFSGTFDGNGHTLSNFQLGDRSQGFAGLFGYVRGATIKDLNMTGVNVMGSSFVGGMVGYMATGEVSNVSVQGTVVGSLKVGGLMGASGPDSRIENATTDVTVSGDNWAGGLLGFTQDGIIKDSSAKAYVFGWENLGGLIGGLWGGHAENVESSGMVDGVPGTSSGGLVGSANGASIRDAKSTAGVRVTVDGQFVGGLVGNHFKSVTINGEASGGVTGGSYSGGLVGSNNYSSVYWSHASGRVTGGQCSGGLSGASGVIKYSYATGDVRGLNHGTGGLSGCGVAAYDVYATGDVTATSGEAVGGLVGRDSYIERGYSSGKVDGGWAYGGSVGMIWSGGTYKAVFWDTDNNVAGMQDVATGDQAEIFGLPTYLLRTKSTFTDAGWDFAGDNNGDKDIWTIEEGVSYPTLVDYQ